MPHFLRIKCREILNLASDHQKPSNRLLKISVVWLSPLMTSPSLPPSSFPLPPSPITTPNTGWVYCWTLVVQVICEIMFFISNSLKATRSSWIWPSWKDVTSQSHTCMTTFRKNWEALTQRSLHSGSLRTSDLLVVLRDFSHCKIIW